jgi:hypothetical protein
MAYFDSLTENTNDGIRIKIVSASYGPCEGLRLSTGEWSSDDSASIPITRDVGPFLRALLIAARTREEQVEQDVDKHRRDTHNYSVEGNERSASSKIDESTSIPQIVRFKPTVGGVTKPFIFLLGNGGKLAMNAVFGDPCPGTSKRLTVHYVVSEKSVTEIYHTSFAEHEKVILRRRLRPAVAQASGKLEEPQQTLVPVHGSLEGSQSIVEFAPPIQQTSQEESRNESDVTSPRQLLPSSPWRLRSAVSEVILPLVLPFLQLQERVDCRRVCCVWKHIVRDWGVATTIDSNDKNITNFSRPFLRGILLHSYSSLHSLVLDGFESLQKDDLHPAIPHLRKLQCLDLSRCHRLDDSTMTLLSVHVHSTLQVLYIKGLERVSDVGVKAICRCCSKLEVLDLSYVPITDEAGIDIQNLPQLRALFMRDNYKLTDKRYVTMRCRAI